jgi:hypothetical protein
MRCYTPLVLFVASILKLQSTAAVTTDVVDWSSGTGDGPLSQSATNDPIVGDGSANSADAEAIHASISGLIPSLSQQGDRVSLAGTVTLAGVTSSNDEFRWGLYDVNSKSDVNGWLGYFGSNGITTQGGILRERNLGNGAGYWLGTSATILATSAPAGASFSSATYSFTLEIERTATDDLQIGWSLTRVGSSTYNLASSFLDTDPSTFSFNRVGFLLGGSLNADQASFQDITVAYIPEPLSSVIGVFGTALLALRRRRNVPMSVLSVKR